MGKLSYIYLVSATERLSITKKHNMTQATTTNSYTRATMNSDHVYMYMKRIARNTSNEDLECLAEALLTSYGFDADIDTRELKAICIRPGMMTTMDYREMECHVTTSLSVVPFSEAHCD